MNDEGRKIFDELEAIARKNTENLLPTKEDLKGRMESGELSPFYSITEERTVYSNGEESVKYKAQGWEKDVVSMYDMTKSYTINDSPAKFLDFNGGYIVASGVEQ